MKLLAIELNGLDLAAVVADESYENLRRLVEAGTFGPLAGQTSQFDGLLATATARRSIAAGGPETSAVDAEVGALLEALDNETVVLVLARGETEGHWYVLAAPGTVPPGETEVVQAGDLATLVADLLTREPAKGDEDDDEALIRERFSGLGYIS